ncbi:type VII secretion-associated protein [Mycobacterium sp. 663a-19]|uniref:type VII secretion-associated protein n=1 Tax=Mycobacterium sp. 663a-19 TaxID=2986148 RepID=UPI002D1F01A3|nr:type VII secretion-associated protein [Mycobacterium sp. 663a-19]MEB3983005.1 type VII secretion-associated protein [Mycobacterium sp. 663a-19]
MSGHCAIIEAGPGTVRRLCCGTSVVADAEMAEAALESIDDPVTMVDGRPVAVDSLWRAMLRSVDCRERAPKGAMVVVHPSWWSSPRVGVVTTAARTLAEEVSARPRSWLLRRGSKGEPEAAVVVEIAERLVAIAGADVVAVPRRSEHRAVAERVASVVDGIMCDATGTVLVDAPATVAGAPALATLIATAMRGRGRRVVEVGDAALPRLAGLAQAYLGARDEPSPPRSAAAVGGIRPHAWMLRGLVAAGVVLAAAVPAVAAMGRHGVTRADAVATAFLVEGRVAVEVPANWPTQRVVAGPGSARVQVTSPSDPEVALHVTQSPVPEETLSDTAERLKRAIDAEPAGVFVDFNPSGNSAGRPAVTYREVRAGHQVRWTVVLDGTVRISIGCQSRPGGEDAVTAACERAVRSAHAIGGT